MACKQSITFNQENNHDNRKDQAVIARRSSIFGGNPLTGQTTHYEGVSLVGDAEMQK